MYPREYSSNTRPGGQKSGCQHSGSWTAKVGWKFSALGMWLAIQCHQLYPSTPCSKTRLYPLQSINLQTFHEMGKRESPRVKEWGRGTPSKEVLFPILSIFAFLPLHSQFQRFSCWHGSWAFWRLCSATLGGPQISSLHITVLSHLLDSLSLICLLFSFRSL